jgi:hypothetical protein
MSYIGRPRKGFNVVSYNQQKVDNMAKRKQQLSIDDFISALCNVLNQNPSMGDETEITSIEQHGLYGLRIITTDGIFLIRIGLDPI